MLKKEIRNILNKSRTWGWVLEPDAKALLKAAGFDIPKSVLTQSHDTARDFLKTCQGPVVIKAVSRKILHKTEHNAVVTRISSNEHLKIEMERLLGLPGCENILVEEMIEGIEVLIGAKNDFQFGPVVVFGIGGTAVEIYNDTAIRMAPLKPGAVSGMVGSLKAGALITGHRGKDGVNLDLLDRILVRFSNLVMDLEGDVESVDLNPVICTKERCVVADARIMLQMPG